MISAKITPSSVVYSPPFSFYKVIVPIETNLFIDIERKSFKNISISFIYSSNLLKSFNCFAK